MERINLTTPPASLLRIYNFVAQIDRLVLERLLPTAQLTLCALSDSLRHVPRSQRIVASSECRYDRVVTALTLSDLQTHIHDASFFSPLSTVKGAMSHMLSKVINIRCQGRKFSAVVLHYMKTNKVVAREICQLILCSLLGNYDHCTFRPSALARRQLYDIFEDRVNSTWILSLIENCGLLVVNAFRDFMIHAIVASPPLHRHVSGLMRFDEFRDIVICHMNKVRIYFDSFIDLSTSALCKSLSKPNDRLYYDLISLVAVSHTQMLRISYRRPNHQMPQFLLSMRKKSPLVAILKGGAVSDEERIAAEIEKAMMMELEMVDAEVATDSVLDIDSYLIPEQSKTLRELVLRMDPLDGGAVLRTAGWFKYFGVKQDTVNYICELAEHYHKGTLSMEKLKQKFELVRQCDPHAYNLLQVTAELVREAQRHYCLIALPNSYRVNQLEAIQYRMPPGVVLSKLFMFVFCPVCETIYSLLRDFASVYKQNYTHGYRDVVSDYTTGAIYCRRTKTNHRGRCGEHPLMQLNLLGKMLLYNNKMIILCPQLKCGVPMVLDSEQCAWNDRGPACCDCTKKWRSEPIQMIELNAKYSPDKPMPCVQCGVQCTPNNACLYPFGLFMCRNHSSPALVKLAESSTATDAVELSKQIVIAVKEWKEGRRAGKQASWKAQRNRNKAASRNKRQN